MDRYNDIKKLISLNDKAINRAKENLEIYQANREEHLHYKSLLENDRMAINSVSEILRLHKIQGKILQRELSRFNATSKEVLKSKPEVKKELKPWSLKPFDKFLYRGTKKGVWEIGFFGYREVSVVGDPDYNWDYFTVGGLDFGTEVLPYNDETKHLHRTSEPGVGNWALIPTILE